MKKSWIICLSIILTLIIGVIGSSKLFLDWIRIEVIKLQTSATEYPWAPQIPLKLELERKKGLGRGIDALGISLDVPWTDMRLTEEKNNTYVFQSENFQISIAQEGHLLVQDFINDMIGAKKAQQFYSYLTQNYDKKVICSLYEFDKIVLNITQENLIGIHQKKKIDMLYMLLILKCQLIPVSAQTGMYHFENDLIRGFRFGTEDTIILWVYNSQGEKYRIDISRRPHSNIRITKSILEEVNRILPTIKFIN
ncbi:hypothetical protein [Cellulosilyticum sp. I15G10I2]|uniref:hypothetical protein n=1 Tax=Cellulosilyticum sp. I15G10I2 TaxID=1892843 RepID=UPI00085CC07E|nr:hypothetical protein [Cellulosilyticum sp. I15G10I2]